MGIILTILLFGVLIFIHEFGHFITAKLSGVKVNEFALGMGPVIWKTRKKDTQYALRLLPIGGFVSMEGEDEESEEEGSFSKARVWNKILIDELDPGFFAAGYCREPAVSHRDDHYRPV